MTRAELASLVGKLVRVTKRGRYRDGRLTAFDDQTVTVHFPGCNPVADNHEGETLTFRRDEVMIEPDEVPAPDRPARQRACGP